MTENLIDGKKYIGQRKYKNNASDETYLGSGNLIKRAIKKYGANNFKRTILAECETREQLNKLEQEYIKQYNAVEDPMFYNLAAGGEGQFDPSPEIREKMRQSQLGKKHTEEFKQFMSSRMRGENHPLYGTHPSAETRKKLSAGQRRRNLKGKNNPWYGHVYTEEEKTRIANSLKGKKHSKERAKKAAQAHQISVLCTTTGVVYPSVSQAAKALNVDGSTISKICRGKVSSAKGYSFAYVGTPMNTKPRKRNLSL